MKSYVVKYKNDDGEWVQSYGGVGEAGARDAFELHKECDHTAYLVTQEDGGEYDSLEFHGDDLGELSNITRECQREKELRTMGDKEENTYNIPTFTVEDTNRTTVHLTRREYFAAECMNAVITSRPGVGWTNAAQSAVEYADALIKELAK